MRFQLYLEKLKVKDSRCHYILCMITNVLNAKLSIYLTKKVLHVPNCGLDEDEVYDITAELAHSANFQMNAHGFYTPIAWWTGSFGDHVALLIFKVLDKFYTQEEKSFQEIAEEHFSSSDWGTQQYMKNHIRDLSYKVYLEIQKQKSITK